MYCRGYQNYDKLTTLELQQFELPLSLEPKAKAFNNCHDCATAGKAKGWKAPSDVTRVYACTVGQCAFTGVRGKNVKAHLAKNHNWKDPTGVGVGADVASGAGVALGAGSGSSFGSGSGSSCGSSSKSSSGSSS